MKYFVSGLTLIVVSSCYIITNKENINNNEIKSRDSANVTYEEEQHYEAMTTQWPESVYDTIRLKREFVYIEKLLQFEFEHCCTFDKGIYISKSSDDSKEEYFHNFESNIYILYDDSLYTMNVSKADFAQSLEPEIYEYGVIIYPNISNKIINNNITIDYSVSIPNTDIGVSRTFVINLDSIISP